MEQMWIRGYEWARQNSHLSDTLPCEFMQQMEDETDEWFIRSPFWIKFRKDFRNGTPHKTSRGYAWGWYDKGGKNEKTLEELHTLAKEY